jgi:hypothetical protein
MHSFRIHKFSLIKVVLGMNFFKKTEKDDSFIKQQRMKTFHTKNSQLRKKVISRVAVFVGDPYLIL